MKKTYLQPTTSGLPIGFQTHLLSNSFTPNKTINVDTNDMEVGDGSDGVKAYGDWEDIW